MGAHAAPRTRTLGAVAGRGALTAAAALALTGGTASMAFAGTSDHQWSKDDRDSDYKDGFRDGYRIGYHDGEDADDEDCDDDGGRDHGTWDDDHDKWDRDHDEKWDRDHDKKWDRDHDKWDKDRVGSIGARYDDSIHKGDDIYTVNYVTKNGLLAGVL
jgi:hypothetical protein